MRYCVGATSCQMQFLFGGYSLGQPGLVIDPFSLVMKPPQAAGQETQHGKRWGQMVSLMQVQMCRQKMNDITKCFHRTCSKCYVANHTAKMKALWNILPLSWINPITAWPACEDSRQALYQLRNTQHVTTTGVTHSLTLLFLVKNNVQCWSWPTAIDAVLIHGL